MRATVLGLTLALASAGFAACSAGGEPEKDVVIGVPEEATTPTSGPKVIVAPEPPPADLFVDRPGRRGNRAEPAGGRHLAQPDGAPWRPAIAFTGTAAVPEDLVFVLVAGSDARPGEALAETRADSIHLLAVNPGTGQGTLLGLPRDSWVEIPGHGRGKINNALALGGPDLLAKSVRRTTGLPVHFYVLTGFQGLKAMVDELGGVDVRVERRMSDRASGALFERGWHNFSGAQALAFSRNRNDVVNGDFSRSENQGRVIVAGLAKMRAEVADDDGIARWIKVLLRHVRLDVPVGRLPALASLARRLDPARLTNVVAPGVIGTAGRQSVVYLTRGAVDLFDDLRDDAVVGAPADPVSAAGPGPANPTAPGPAVTTSTSAPVTSSTSTPPTTSPTDTTSTTTSGNDVVPIFPDDPPDSEDSEDTTTTTEDSTTTTTTTAEDTTTTTSTAEGEPTTSTTADDDEFAGEDDEFAR
ncbi:MAG: LCP family protein [Acidimicrobiia bacterium]